MSRKVETYVVTLRREVLQEAEVIVEDRSPTAAADVANGMRDVVIWKTLDATYATYPPTVRVLSEPLPKKRKPKRKVRGH